MNFLWTTIAGIIGSIAALCAAVLWLRASIIKVPSDIDTIVEKLQQMSRWNAWAARAAAVAAFCGFLVAWLGQYPAILA
jgi:hypothetical protein